MNTLSAPIAPTTRRPSAVKSKKPRRVSISTKVSFGDSSDSSNGGGARSKGKGKGKTNTTNNAEAIMRRVASLSIFPGGRSQPSQDGGRR
eukprot:CAMPEP_0113564120 /NCGR_PEP_ID=MMETSP0015_2-20120614/21440_1 /TAXON_ID=2838 /ORGANISM="Odontella" /LENGTH=89 /DNA_ID=CAMNT_0000466161 /DNA_START=94 /DNA_END=360 /DNA_ORIENTATION=- /assembly_acc=CAM_ASM_000160